MTTNIKREIMLDSLLTISDGCPVASVSMFDQFTFGFL